MADTSGRAGVDGAADQVDGRRARRERNRIAVLDAVLEMFSEEMLVPTIEQAAERSGLSLRSVYRYFPDPDALLSAAVQRQLEIVRPLARLHAIGQGPFDDRLSVFTTMRVELHEHVGPSYRSTLHQAGGNAEIREYLSSTRQQLSDQFEQQFAPELDALAPADRRVVFAAGDVLSQFESIDVLRRSRGLTGRETAEVIGRGLRAILGPQD
jgi:AcrR family transcriptional regulator